MRRLTRWVTVAACAALPAHADGVTVAVASNFLTTAEALAEAFEAGSDHEVSVAHGATGQLYAQIVAGAPFDIFLSADDARPARLQDEGLASDRRTYAIGRLVLLSRTPVDLEDPGPSFEGQTVVLADPIVAPYGLAATAAMENLGLDTASFRPVLVGNVGQAAVVFLSGNATLAFVAASLLPYLDAAVVTDLDGRYPAIRQDGVLLARAESPAAQAFWDFIASAEGRAIIEAAGYGVPQ